MSNFGVTTKYSDEQLKLSKEVLDDIADYVKFQLGAPIVDVEISDQVLLKIIEMALRKLSKYNVVVLWHTTKPTTKAIDLSTFPHRVSYIIDILKSRGDTVTSSTAMSSMFGFPAGLQVFKHTYGGYGSAYNMSDLTSVFAESVIMARNLSAYKDSLSIDYDYANNVIYVDAGIVNTENITIEYVPVLTINDLYLFLSDQSSYDLVVEYATAMCMITLGRARGKYSTNNYDWSLSANELLQTGSNKIKELDDLLNTNYSHVLMD